MRFHPGLVSGLVTVFAPAVLAHPVEHLRPFARAEQVHYQSFQTCSIVLADQYQFEWIVGEFVVPTIPASGDVGSGVDIFVAMGGHICNGASLRAGIKAQIDENNSPVYTPFYHSYPASMQTFENITVSPGDTIFLAVEMASDAMSGNVMIVNGSQNQTSVVQVTPPVPLCLLDVSWCIEPPYNTDHSFFYPLVNFQHVYFDYAYAMGDGDQLIMPTDAHDPEIVENDQQMTDVYVDGATINIVWLSH